MGIDMLPIDRIIVDRNADCLGNGMTIGTSEWMDEWVRVSPHYRWLLISRLLMAYPLAIDWLRNP